MLAACGPDCRNHLIEINRGKQFGAELLATWPNSRLPAKALLQSKAGLAQSRQDEKPESR